MFGMSHITQLVNLRRSNRNLSQKIALTCRHNGEKRFSVVLSPVNAFPSICCISVFLSILFEIKPKSTHYEYALFGLRCRIEQVHFIC